VGSGGGGGPQKADFSETFSAEYMRAICKICGLTLLLQVGTLWRCGDGLFFEVPPMASDALLTVLHPLLKNVLQTLIISEFLASELPFHGGKAQKSHGKI
jgi:hypothetical protein